MKKLTTSGPKSQGKKSGKGKAETSKQDQKAESPAKTEKQPPMKKVEILNIPIKEIEIKMARPEYRFKGKGFEELCRSIKEQGIIHPVIVRPSGNKKTPYIAVCGHRRLAAVEVNTEGGANLDAAVPAILRDVNEDQAFEIMITENLHRADVSQREEAESFKAYLDVKGKDFIDDLADKVGKKAGYIRKRIKILKLPAEILEAWDNEELSFGHCEQFVRLSEKEAAEFYNDHFRDAAPWDRPTTVSDMKRAISDMNPSLNKALFDTKNCLKKCRKNTEVQASLFDMPDDKDEAGCLDQKCFVAKTKQYLDAVFTPEYKKEKKVCGFKIKDGTLDNYRYYYQNWPECDKCENLLIVANIYGEQELSRACFDPECLEAKILKESRHEGKNKSGGNSGSDYEVANIEKRRENGLRFRQDFFAEAIPQKITAGGINEKAVSKIHSYCEIMGNRQMMRWFLRREHPEENEELIYGTSAVSELRKKVFDWISSCSETDFRLVREEAVKTDLFSASYSKVELEHDDILYVAQMLGTDLRKEWLIHADYLKSKTKKEIMAIGNHFKVFESPDVSAYLEDIVKKKLENCKKSELIDLFLESGLDLSGMVPDEVLHAGHDLPFYDEEKQAIT